MNQAMRVPAGITLGACPVCASADVVTLEPAHDFDSFTTMGDEFTFRIGSSGCLACGFIFLNPRASQSAMFEYYRRQSRIPRSLDMLGQAYTELLERQASFIRRQWNPIGAQRILDVGCAEGFFLERLGREVPGEVTLEAVEPSTVYAAAARAVLPHVNIHEGMLEDADLPPAAFDLITIRHVLEHVQSPLEALTLLRRAMRPGGLLHIEVPDVVDVPASVSSLFHHEHLNYFTDDSLRGVLARAGFQVAEIEAANDNPKNSGFAYPVLRVLAVPGDVQANASPPAHDVVDLYVRHTQLRGAYLAARIDPVRALLGALARDGKRIGVFGAGPHTLDVFSALDLPAATWSAIFDNNPNKAGRTLRGVEIARPTPQTLAAVDVVLVSSAEFEREIVAQLESFDLPDLQVVTLYGARSGETR